jgi:hypothetical protein
MKFICKRCNYSTNHRGTIINHLNRKNECSPNNEDISREKLLEELQLLKDIGKQYECENCDSKFSHSSSYYRHKRRCKEEKLLLSKSELTEMITNEVKEQMKNIIPSSTTQNIGIQNNNITNNNNQNITNNNNINNYYDINKPSYSEKLFTLDEQIKLIKEAADDPVTFGMSAYHREKYFNENRKELQCIKLTPDLLQKSKIGIYNGKYWEEKNLHELLPQITDEAGQFMGLILFNGKTAFQIDRQKNMEMRDRVDDLLLYKRTPEEESNKIIGKMTDDFVKYTEQIYN